MNDINFLPNSATNNFIFCPNNNCLNIPNIKYDYNPLQSNIQYICNYNNNNEINNINLSQFLEKSSNIKCSKCQLNIKNNDIYYCKECKKIYDYSCFEEHIDLCNHEVIPIDKINLSNICLQHFNRFIFYCKECNKSLCSFCDLNYHNNQRHNLVQIINSLCNNNYKEKIDLIFQKQKNFLEKIKKMNEKFIQSLENDILIKQKIIESNINNKYNYQSISNFNNLNIENDVKFEKIIEKIIEKEDEMEKNNNNILDNETFINRIIVTFYYSLMINKDKNMNNSLIKTMDNLISKLNDNNKGNNNHENSVVHINNNANNNDIKIVSNDIDYIYDKKDTESNNNEIKVNNYINIENNRNNNNNFNISVDCSKRYYHIANDNNQSKNLFKVKTNISNNTINNKNKFIIEEYIKKNNKDIDFFRNNINTNKKINFFEDEKSITTLNKKDDNSLNFFNNNLSIDNSPNKTNKILNQSNITLNENNHINNLNINYSKNNNPDIIFQNNNSNINTLSTNITPLSNTKNNISLSNSKQIFNTNLINNNINNTCNIYNSNNINENLNNNNGFTFNLRKPKKIIIDNKTLEEKKKKTKKVEKITNNNFNDMANAPNVANNQKEGTTNNNKNNNNNPVYNMIMLHTGNFAISMKEAIEIYDFRKLNLGGTCTIIYNNNQIKENNCLLQRINLVKSKKINYVFEFPDQTLLCGTYSKIFRLKLTNNDLSHSIIGIIKLGSSEHPTQLISLGDSLLIALTEQKANCNIKVFKKIDNENKIEDEKISDSNSIQSNENNDIYSDKDIESNDYNDVAPPIGNSLFAKKELEVDQTFQLMHNNINKERKLLLAIYEIKKENNNNNNGEYLYEFVATSNKVYNLGDNRIEFYVTQRIGNGKLFFNKIKIINNISCSIQVNSICQIKDKYLCVGLQNHDLIGQISGFALIDIYKKDICRIIRDQEISCMYYNLEKNLLFASMEVRDIKKNYFMSKVYEVCNIIGDKGIEDINLKQIYRYKNGHTDTISSIFEINTICYKDCIDQEKINNNIILCTASHDSNLEVIKANIQL